MGQEAEGDERVEAFAGWTVNEAMLARASPARSSCTACPPTAARRSTTRRSRGRARASGTRRRTACTCRRRCSCGCSARPTAVTLTDGDAHAVRAVADRGPAPGRRVDGARVVGRGAARGRRRARAARRGPRSAARRARLRGAHPRGPSLAGARLGRGADCGRASAARRYEHAIARLAAKGLVYPCDCSRAEIARVGERPARGRGDRLPRDVPRRRPGARHEARAGAARARAGRGRRATTTCGRATSSRTSRATWATSSCGAATGSSPTSSRSWSTTWRRRDHRRRARRGPRGVDAAADLARRASLGLERAALSRTSPLVVAPDGARLEKRTRGATVRELRDAGVARGAHRRRARLRPGAGADERARTAARSLPPPPGASRWRTEPWPIPGPWPTVPAATRACGEGVASGSPRTQRKPSAGTW